MTYFISGGAKNGKSTLAQNLAVALGEKRYYVATMISTGEEDDERICRHIADRAGLGFETVECFRDIMDCLKTADKNGVFLVDSVTALIQNSLFPVEKNYEMDLAAAERCADGLVEFAKTVRHAIFVSDYIYSDAERYSESTEMYRKCLAGIDRRLAKVCDTVIEVSAGQCIIHKSCHCEERGAPRSESKISMLAGGKHTWIPRDAAIPVLTGDCHTSVRTGSQ